LFVWSAYTAVNGFLTSLFTISIYRTSSQRISLGSKEMS